ncbi:MAG: hypothetical protein JWL90_3171 [Chthoniobacteraceae bacterium]|nr:hypothetical protein [Chthoniobacteraceae bacterium]
MELTLTNVRGAPDLAMGMVESVNMDNWHELRKGLQLIIMPVSSVDFLVFCFDECLPETHYEEGRFKSHGYYALCGIEKARFLLPLDKAGLRSFAFDFITTALTRMELPDSDKTPVLKCFSRWRAEFYR